ncbi:MAG: hypothetical protein ACYTBJ_20150, partial [Planctomycetota bacterium]
MGVYIGDIALTCSLGSDSTEDCCVDLSWRLFRYEISDELKCSAFKFSLRLETGQFVAYDGVHIDNIGLRYVLGADSDSNGYMESHDFAVLASRWLRCA